ncbi:MAG: hypothetical protein SVM79_08060 [Chloroflexota bacterium]|nr:hypothetical protein [Chloroflexota bacterium]
MGQYETLKTKWLPPGNANPLDYQKLTPEGFFIRISSENFDLAGSNSAYGEYTCSFETAADALAFVRFNFIPEYSHVWTSVAHTGSSGLDISYEEIAAFSNRLEELGIPIRMEELLGMLDINLRSEDISQQTLEDIFSSFNQVFSILNPANEIIAWGGLTEYLLAPWASLVLDDVIEFAIDENQKENMYLLRKLLKSRAFEKTDSNHFSLAKEFLQTSNYGS